MTNQAEFNDIPVRYTTEKHVACVFLLDTSSSMNVKNQETGVTPIEQLNEGLKAFKEQTLANLDSRAKACIDVAIVTFDDEVKVIQEFAPVEEMNIPTLVANGQTSMGGALEQAMDMVTMRKNVYGYAGTPYYRPWIFCITDGGPNDDYREVAVRLKWMEENKKVVAFCVGVDGFRVDIMKDIFNQNNIYGLRNCDFTGLFKFVSSSLDALRTSTDESGASIDVPAPNTMFRIPLD